MSRVLKVLLGTMFIGQTVFAQTGAPAPAAPAPGAPPAEADIGVRARAVLSPQEMMTQGREYRERVRAAIGRIEGQVKQATNQKDIIRVNCLTDKLVQARAHLRIADQSVTSLEENVRRADEGATLHEYTRLTIVNQKVQLLTADADQCIGEDLSFVGATRVDVDVDDNIDPDLDPTQPPPPSVDPVGTRPDTQSPST